MAGECTPKMRWAHGAWFWVGMDGGEGEEGFVGLRGLWDGLNKLPWELDPVATFDNGFDEREDATGVLAWDNCEGTIPGENAMRKLRAITATVSRYFWRVTTLDITSGTLGPVY